jgi:drug/metabolite transporter (DMT)-like permease
VSATAATAADRSAVLKGVALSLTATLMFTCNDTLVKWLTQHHPIAQLVWARYVFHFLLMLVLFRPSRPLALLRTQRPGLQILRALLLLGSTAFFFTAVSFIPIADATAIGLVGPLIATLLAVPILGEPIGIRRILACVVGFIGALVILRPGLGVMHWAAILPLGSAMVYACFQIATRSLGPTEAPENTLFYAAIVGTVVSSLVVPFYWQPIEPSHWPLLVLIGGVGGIGHYFVIRAYRLVPVGVLAPFGYFSLITATLTGWLAFGHLPDRWTVVGALILTGSGLYVLYRETVRRRERQAKA